jgi:hypothetical protein
MAMATVIRPPTTTAMPPHTAATAGTGRTDTMFTGTTIIRTSTPITRMSMRIIASDITFGIEVKARLIG